jgi:hypothetical protein
MIRTTTPVKYDILSPEKEAIVYAQVVDIIRKPRNKTYTLVIEEWIINEYQQEVPTYDEEGNQTGTEIQTFQSKQILPQERGNTRSRVRTYQEIDTLIEYIENSEEFDITETGCDLRDRYTVLGHLITNNQQQVYGTSWIEVE